MSSVSVAVCVFSAEDFFSFDLIRRSLKPFYPAIHKLHRPRSALPKLRSVLLSVGKITDSHLWYLQFGIFYINRLKIQVCVIISNHVSSV